MKSPKLVSTANVATEPVSLADIYAYLRLNTIPTSPVTHPDDIMLSSYIKTARELVERNTGRLLTSRAVTAKYDGFATHMMLPYGADATTLTSINYLDTQGQSTLLAGSDYYLYFDFGVPILSIYSALPNTFDKTTSVTVTYTTGYTTVPAPLIDAIKLLVRYFYDDAPMDKAFPQLLYNALIQPYMTGVADAR